MKKNLSIAIDGPAAAGKSTVAKIVAEKLSYIYIDTGAMYRALTYEALRENINLENAQGLFETLINFDIRLVPSKNGQLVFANNQDITSEIRTSEVSNSVSIVSKHQKIREEMVKRQQSLAVGGGIVMDGRDIGTYVLPYAEVKVFLLASVEERAARRHTENLEKGILSNLSQLQAEIAKRDQIDSNREFAPLKKAEDAVEIDTTSLRIEDVVGKIMEIVYERMEEA